MASPAVGTANEPTSPRPARRPRTARNSADCRTGYTLCSADVCTTQGSLTSYYASAAMTAPEQALSSARRLLNASGLVELHPLKEGDTGVEVGTDLPRLRDDLGQRGEIGAHLLDMHVPQLAGDAVEAEPQVARPRTLLARRRDDGAWRRRLRLIVRRGMLPVRAARGLFDQIGDRAR